MQAHVALPYNREIALLIETIKAKTIKKEHFRLSCCLAIIARAIIGKALRHRRGKEACCFGGARYRSSL